MDETGGGKRYVFHGPEIPRLLTAVAKFFEVATETAEELKWVAKAGAEALVEHLKVVKHPEVQRGRIEVAIMASRDAKSRADRERHRRETRAPSPHKDQLERKQREVMEGKPPEVVPVVAELKHGTEPQKTHAPEHRKGPPKKGLTHNIPADALTVSSPPAAPPESEKPS